MKNIVLLLVTVVFFSCNEQKPQINYPVTKKGDVKDTYFGVEVEDPYRWLEDDHSE
ncbi:MAG: hypothetical protein R3182_11725, partial [Draconibacterium sp.]|nr:hypothetical protein [Draconibacterium sp.]